MPHIDNSFADKLLRCFDNPQTYGVHLLFDDWWATAPDGVIDAYLHDFTEVPDQADFARSG